MFVLPFAGNRNQDRPGQDHPRSPPQGLFIGSALVSNPACPSIVIIIIMVQGWLGQCWNYTATELNEMMSCWWWNLSRTINRMTDSYQTTTADAFVGWQLNYKRRWWWWPWGCNNSTDEHREEAYYMLDDGPVNRFWNLAQLMTSGRDGRIRGGSFYPFICLSGNIFGK